MYKLHLDQALDSANIKTWGTATKTAPLKCKPMRHIFHDFHVIKHLLLNTLEGQEPIDLDAMYCVGPAGDMWQAPLSVIDEKYDVVTIDFSGWWNCIPKVTANVEYYVVSGQDVSDYGWGRPTAYVISKTGEIATLGWIDADEPDTVLVQTALNGDFICRTPGDPLDVTVVPRRIFLNTYTITKTVKP